MRFCVQQGFYMAVLMAKGIFGFCHTEAAEQVQQNEKNYGQGTLYRGKAAVYKRRRTQPFVTLLLQYAYFWPCASSLVTASVTARPRQF
ncbi:hypothetical protein NPIL_456701 [Nephila pilipes]|uniref:Uncharacterized protein n=1 Tax=Nephila pilipes TaxID=299642 RepID=A0A8X6QSI9_NEPPI|nr:hypothetical protein NPIL_456701 [Nephila pilipes]